MLTFASIGKAVNFVILCMIMSRRWWSSVCIIITWYKKAWHTYLVDWLQIYCRVILVTLTNSITFTSTISIILLRIVIFLHCIVINVIIIIIISYNSIISITIFLVLANFLPVLTVLFVYSTNHTLLTVYIINECVVVCQIERHAMIGSVLMYKAFFFFFSSIIVLTANLWSSLVIVVITKVSETLTIVAVLIYIIGGRRITLLIWKLW